MWPRTGLCGCTSDPSPAKNTLLGPSRMHQPLTNWLCFCLVSLSGSLLIGSGTHGSCSPVAFTGSRVCCTLCLPPWLTQLPARWLPTRTFPSKKPAASQENHVMKPQWVIPPRVSAKLSNDGVLTYRASCSHRLDNGEAICGFCCSFCTWLPSLFI